MLEQELASIMKFTLDRAGNPSPYYYEVPQSFNVPAVYFPTPEIITGGETLASYRMEYAWYIKIFHRSSQQAYAIGLEILTAIKGNRNLIPLISQTGEKAEGNIRINDPKLKVLDNGAAQLTVEWTSRRPYNRNEAVKMQTYDVECWNKAEQYTSQPITEAMEAALERYVVPATV